MSDAYWYYETVCKRKDWSHEFISSLKGDTLTRTKEKFSPESVLNELSMFKEECDDNEQALSFELITKTGLYWEVILEICKYLSLNDAINAFSTQNMSELDLNVIKTSKQTIRTDSDIEESDDNTFDNDNENMDFIRFPSECENEVQDIDSLSKGFEQGYNACLMFFMGSLKDACQAAFSPTAIEERRPVLVYIHHDDSLFREKFCETMFYSTTIIDYLNINYVVWPYEVTLESNRYTLAKIWEEMFSTKFFDDFSIEQCPLLIGVMRLFEHKIDGVVTSEYQFKTLVKGNTLTRTEMAVNRENLCNELNIFEEECHKNEQDLSFDFVRKTNLSWEIILEIAEYLSLNDAISAFSINIFPLLNNPQSKFQLSNPCDQFIKMILPKIKSEQIVSLQFNTSRLWSKTELTFLSKFREVISVTLHNPSHSNEINQYIYCFPKLVRLSLDYDDKADYYILSDLLSQLQQQIRRFEIHCPKIFCTNDDIARLKKRHTLTTEVKYFLIDVGHHRLTSTDSHFPYDKPGFFMPFSDFMKKMPTIRYIHIVSNKDDIKHFLDDDPWKLILNICSELKKIILQVFGNTFYEKRWLIKKIQEIQTILRNIRPTIAFKLVFL